MAGEPLGIVQVELEIRIEAPAEQEIGGLAARLLLAAATLLPALGVDPADHIVIAENKIIGRGILTTAARFGRARANEVYNIECGTGAGIWLSRFSDGWVVRDNYLHDIPAATHHPMSEGIRQGSSSAYNLIANNLVEALGGSGRGITSDTFSSWNVMSR